MFDGIKSNTKRIRNSRLAVLLIQIGRHPEGFQKKGPNSKTQIPSLKTQIPETNSRN
jgi:hypothetical protein